MLKMMWFSSMIGPDSQCAQPYARKGHCSATSTLSSYSHVQNLTMATDNPAEIDRFCTLPQELRFKILYQLDLQSLLRCEKVRPHIRLHVDSELRTKHDEAHP